MKLLRYWGFLMFGYYCSFLAHGRILVTVNKEVLTRPLSIVWGTTKDLYLQGHHICYRKRSRHQNKKNKNNGADSTTYTSGATRKPLWKNSHPVGSIVEIEKHVFWKFFLLRKIKINCAKHQYWIHPFLWELECQWVFSTHVDDVHCTV